MICVSEYLRMKSVLPFYILLGNSLINIALSNRDFIVIEPQETDKSLHKNVTVNIFYELDYVDDIILSLGSPKFETGRGFLIIPGTSLVHTLSGLAKVGYSLVGYARDKNNFDRWTMQRIEEKS